MQIITRLVVLEVLEVLELQRQLAALSSTFLFSTGAVLSSPQPLLLNTALSILLQAL